MKDQIIQSFIESERLPSGYADAALNWFIPLAELMIRHQQRADKTLFVGLNGCQGAGKSTLTQFLKYYIEQSQGKRVAILSIDDFYFSQLQRQQLANKVHPLLQTRGVPGTHDIQLLSTTLQAIDSGVEQVLLPRFNKATDNPFPISQWPTVSEPVDILILEGWCWGAESESDVALVEPVNDLERKEDPKGVWRQYVNQQLKTHYQPLYKMMDFWLLLQAPSFDCVYQWRLEQEHRLAAKASTDKSAVMTDQQVHRFIQHYQRLTQHILRDSKQRYDVTLQLNTTRQVKNAIGLIDKEPALE